MSHIVKAQQMAVYNDKKYTVERHLGDRRTMAYCAVISYQQRERI